MSQPMSATHVFYFQGTSTRASCDCSPRCISACCCGPGDSRHLAHVGGPRALDRGVFFPCLACVTDPTVSRHPEIALLRSATAQPPESSSLCWPPRERGIQLRQARTPSIDELPRGDRMGRRLGHHLPHHTVPVTSSFRLFARMGATASRRAHLPPEHRSSTSTLARPADTPASFDPHPHCR